MLDCGIQKAASLIWPGTPETDLNANGRCMTQNSGLMRWMSVMSDHAAGHALHGHGGPLSYTVDGTSWNVSPDKLSPSSALCDFHLPPSKGYEMDLKDGALMMGNFTGPNECNLSVINAYHELGLSSSLEQPQQQQSQTHQSQLPVSISAGSMSSSGHVLPQQHSQQGSQTQHQSQTTATPVISLFKLKNFLYQPKFKNLLHSSGEAQNGINNGSNNLDDPNLSAVQSQTNQQYPNAVSSVNRNSLANSNSPQNNNTNSNNNNSVGQILGLTQPFKFSSHLQSSNGPNRKYQCKMCPQIFHSKADMQLHTQVHMREAKPYKCSQCSKSFANSSYLSQHTRIHLGIKPYRCEICQRKFTQLSHLQQHLRTHTGDKPYKCRYPNCNKAFSQLSNLQSHSRSHQTDKPFKCNSCYKCFTDEASLLDHIPKHKDSKHLKTHICQFCGKSYTQETYLAKHMQKHADRLDKRTSQNRASAQLSAENYWPKGPGNSCQTSSLECSPNSMINSQQQQQHQHHQQQQQQQHQSPVGQDQQCLHSSLNSDVHALSSPRYDQSNRLPMSGLPVINSRTSDDTIYGLESKNGNSAFTPLQSTGVLSGARMSYFSYESINFPTKTSSGNEVKKTMEVSTKTGPTSFPNQLIALNQIRNYASMPSSVSITSA